MVVQRMTKDVARLLYLTLTRTNYRDWSLLMKVMLETHGLWDALESKWSKIAGGSNGVGGHLTSSLTRDDCHPCYLGYCKGGMSHDEDNVC